jgi:MoaA/NifB/PqqE/SkfB family radical SAM enzyme
MPDKTDGAPPEAAPDYASLTHANEAAVLACEAAASPRVEALPMKLTFEFTGDCNLHCFFCDCEFGRNEYRKRGITKFSMDEATFRRIAEAAFPKATVVNPTVVGEPFTFPYFDLMLEYAERFAVKLEIITNGMLLKGPRVERLLPLLDRMTISFDGGTKETFEHCRSGSKFDVVIENLRRFRDLRKAMGLESRVKFTFGVTLMRENVEELPRIVEWAKELEVDEVCAGHLLVFTKELKGSSLFEHKELSNRSIEAARLTALRLGVMLQAPAPFATLDVAPPIGEVEVEDGAGFTGMAPRPEHAAGGDSLHAVSTPATRPMPAHMAHESPPPDWAKDRFWCKFAWREAFILHSGDVAPCCHQSRPVVGNVFETEWDQIWNGLVYQSIRTGLFTKAPTPFCGSCSLLAEQGFVPYAEEGYIFEDRYPEQSRADIRPKREKKT